MATEQPGPSPVADPRHLRAGEPVSRRNALARPDVPGVLRVCAMVGETLHDVSGAEALDRLPEFLRQPETSVWIDLAGPSHEQVEAVGAALSLHPLIIEDVLEGNQRAKLELTNGVVHMVLFHLLYDEQVVAMELDMVLGLGFLLTVHGGGWDPHESHHLAGGTENILRHGPDHLLWALCDDIVDGYFPFSDQLGDAIDEVQDEVMRQGHAADPRARVRSQAAADRGPPVDQPGPRGVQPADQPRHAAHRRERDRLLPRRLRPPHPAHRRARHVPRARGVDARRVPDPGQQQPVGRS